MKLAWKEIEPFVKSPNPKARAILIYGPDDGLMRERSTTIGKTVTPDLNDPFNVAVLDGDLLVADPARLFDEASAISMMGGARLIRIENASDKISPVLREYLEKPSAENLVILEAGELGPKSPLRALFEKSPNAAALPCYVEDERGIATVMRAQINAANKTIDADALTWLAGAVVGDRGRARSEVEKLLIYMGDDNKIRLEDVRNACGEAGETSLDDLIYAVAGGRTEIALATFNKLNEEGVVPVTILRALQNHFRKLHYTRSLMASGLGAHEAMKQLQPPIFFKLEDSFLAQINKWSSTKLMAILERLTQIEADTKKTGAPTETLMAQAVLGIAKM